MKLRINTNEASRSVSVACLDCGRMVKLCDAIIDFDGPSFKAYYHKNCAAIRFGEEPVETANEVDFRSSADA